MTFWHWIRNMKGMEHGRPDLRVVARINDLLDTGHEFSNSNPQNFEEIKDTLMPHGFDREELKQAWNLWTDSQR